jgi:hypothetical protein
MWSTDGTKVSIIFMAPLFLGKFKAKNKGAKEVIDTFVLH